MLNQDNWVIFHVSFTICGCMKCFFWSFSKIIIHSLSGTVLVVLAPAYGRSLKVQSHPILFFSQSPCPTPIELVNISIHFKNTFLPLISSACRNELAFYNIIVVLSFTPEHDYFPTSSTGWVCILMEMTSIPESVNPFKISWDTKNVSIYMSCFRLRLH